MLKHKLWKLIGLVILAYILSRIDWPQFLRVVRDAKITLILTAFLLNIPQLWLKSTRWQALLSAQGKRIKNVDAFLYYLGATYLGVITPGRVGEFVKALYLKQHGIATISYGFSSVLVDRLWDLLLLVVLGLAGLIVIHPFEYAALIGWVGLAGLVGLLAFLIFSSSIGKVAGIIYGKFLSSKIPKAAKEGAGRFGDGLRDLWGKRIGLSAGLTCLAYGLFFLQCAFIAHGFGLPLSYVEIVPIMAMVNLFSFLPVSVSGLGTRDAALLFLLTRRGLGYESIVAFSMGILIVFYVGGGLLGLTAWFLRPITLKKG